MQKQPQKGDRVEFDHPAHGQRVEGVLVNIVEDVFYVVDDGETRPMHHLAIHFASRFNFRVIDEESHAE